MMRAIMAVCRQWSAMVALVGNGWYWSAMVGNGRQWSIMVENGRHIMSLPLIHTIHHCY